MDDKALYGLIGVILGWLLTQGATIGKEILGTQRRKNALLEELKDIDHLLERVILSSARHLQIFALRGCDPNIPIDIQNHFYRQHFKEIFSSLNREQRLSYQTIHGHVDFLNKQLNTLAKAREKCYELRGAGKEALAIAALNEWGDVVKSIFLSSQELRWHVRYHLDHPIFPVLEAGDCTHQEFLRVRTESRDAIKRIMEQAKNLERGDFEAS